MTAPRGVRTLLLVAAAALLQAQGLRAQTASGGVDGTSVGGSLALASMWDDETFLGRGPAVAGEVYRPVGARLRVGAEAGWFGHQRDSGYLAADGHVVSLMGRASLLLGPRSWRLRPLLGAGVGVVRSTGTLTSRTSAPGVSGVPESRTPWTLTRPAWDFQIGARVAAGDRLAVRPEVRAGFAGGAGDRGVLEPPLLRLQAGLTVEWAVR